MKYIDYKKSDKIAIITIDRPERLNAINFALTDELIETFSKAENDPEIRVVIITGKGERAFIAGGDIGEMKEMSLLESERFVYNIQAFYNQIEFSRKIVIAALNGYTLGGGFELALACDLRIAAEHAELGLPEVSVGVFPGAGGTQRLVRLVGSGIAKQLIFTGERISAGEAKQLGIVNKVVPINELMDTSIQLANQIIKNSPLAVIQAKKAINHGRELPMEKASVLEAEAWIVTFATEDRMEGMQAFIEKREANYKGR